MIRTSFRALLAALTLSATASAPAHAALMRCADAEQAPAASERDPLVKRARSVWDGVYGVSRAMTGYETRVKFLAESARNAEGQPFASNAMICVGGPPTIYVTWPLLRSVFVERAYPVDFLAVVLGHELGHRLHDLDAAGNMRSQPPEVTGTVIEARADVRGAYLASAAGFSTRKVACDDCMDDYLEAEHHVRTSARARRKGELQAVLREFDGLEALYEASVAVTFWDAKLAARMLEWADTQMKTLHAPVAEFKILRGVVELAVVARESPVWLEDAALRKLKNRAHRALAARLRCSVVYPSHTALREDERLEEGAPEPTMARSAGGGLERLKKAEALFEEAAALGAGELVVNSGLACVAFYKGDTKSLVRYAERASRALPKKPPKAVAEAVKANAALGRFLAWLEAHPAPRGLKAEGAGEWRKELSKARRGFDEHPELAEVATELARIDSGDKAKAAMSARADVPLRSGKEKRCRAPRLKGLAASAMAPRVPRAPRAGQCPCGWSPVAALTVPAEDPTAEPYGITTCLPAGWSMGRRYVHVRLPGDGSGPLVDLALQVVDALPERLRSFGQWQKACGPSLAKQGTSDQGQVAWSTACAPLGVSGGVVFSDGQCGVERVVQLVRRAGR